MKRLWVLFLALCTAMLSCIGVLIPSAEGANTDVWNVYSLLEDKDGEPYFGTTPAYGYTEEGLKVTPSEEIGSYTIQTDHAYRMDDGLYMEIKLDQTVDAGMLVFHLWDQSGFLLSNLNCGSGWQGMLQLNRNETQLMISAYVHGSTLTEEGRAVVMGGMKIPAPVAEDGSVSYSICLRDEVLQINGHVVDGMEGVLSFLREKTGDGSVYLGVSVLRSEFASSIPLTVSRFGTSPENASVPGTDGELPETGGDALETGGDAPETAPSAPSDTTAPSERETDPAGSATKPDDGGIDTPAETSPGEDTAEPEDTVEVETEDPYGDPETEPETRKEIHNDKVDSFMSKLEGCSSAIGPGIFGFMTALAAAFIGLRKRD